jgi:prephenate dehydrogenase
MAEMDAVEKEKTSGERKARDGAELPPGSPFGGKIGVIGGMGEMGRLFAGFFRDRGYEVEVADVGVGRSNEEVVRDSDIVLFAVPLHLTEQIIGGLIPCTRPGQLLMDLTSLKAGPVREMLRSPASVVGLHPMFGGRTSSFVGQTIAACPARIDPSAWKQLRGLFAGAGLRVKECSPEEHDRMMSFIQVLFHMTTMLIGRLLRETGVNIDDTLEFTSPSYRIEMSLLGRIFAQNGSLYSAITMMNPNTRDLIEMFRSGLDAYEKWYDTKDLDAFVSDFDLSARHLGDFCRRAFGESSAILDFAVKWAAEREARGNDRESQS